MIVVLQPTEKWILALFLLALLPFAPIWGWVCFGGLVGVVFHLRDALRGFSLLGWLAGCSPGSLPSCFERLVFMKGASDSTPPFSWGEGSGS